MYLSGRKGMRGILQVQNCKGFFFQLQNLKKLNSSRYKQLFWMQRFIHSHYFTYRRSTPQWVACPQAWPSNQYPSYRFGLLSLIHCPFQRTLGLPSRFPGCSHSDNLFGHPLAVPLPVVVRGAAKHGC